MEIALRRSPEACKLISDLVMFDLKKLVDKYRPIRIEVRKGLERAGLDDIADNIWIGGNSNSRKVAQIAQEIERFTRVCVFTFDLRDMEAGKPRFYLLLDLTRWIEQMQQKREEWKALYYTKRAGLQREQDLNSVNRLDVYFDPSMSTCKKDFQNALSHLLSKFSEKLPERQLRCLQAAAAAHGTQDVKQQRPVGRVASQTSPWQKNRVASSALSPAAARVERSSRCSSSEEPLLGICVGSGDSNRECDETWTPAASCGGPERGSEIETTPTAADGRRALFGTVLPPPVQEPMVQPYQTHQTHQTQVGTMSELPQRARVRLFQYVAEPTEHWSEVKKRCHGPCKNYLSRLPAGLSSRAHQGNTQIPCTLWNAVRHLRNYMSHPVSGLDTEQILEKALSNCVELAYDLDLVLRTYVKWFVLEKETLVRVIPYDWV